MVSRNAGQARRRRWPWIVVGLIVVVAVGGPLGLGAVGRRAAQADAVPAGRVATITRGDLSASATASGKLEARREAGLSFEVTGRVTEVRVTVGDRVDAGAVLVRLDTGALERKVANARLALVIQEANLQDLRAGATAVELAASQAAVASAAAHLADVQDGPPAADVAAARASLAAAQAAYDDLRAGPDAAVVAQAQASLKNAEAALQQAQAAYDRVAGSSDIGLRRESLELQQATNNLTSAQAAYTQATAAPTPQQLSQAQANLAQARAALQKLLDSPAPTEVAAAESQLAQAQASLETARTGAGVGKLAVAEAQVAQAQLTLEEAEESLSKATLTAPFAGIVTAVHIVAGEQATGLAVELADAAGLDLVLDVDEVDLSQLAVGQPAVLTLETWPGQAIAGEVTAIAPQATAGGGAVVSYAVHVRLGETELPLRSGMTADADLVTAARQAVLLAPSEAITADREAGLYSVNIVEQGADGVRTFTSTPVTIGLKDGAYTEITSGLQEGDQVWIGAIVTAAPAARPGFLMPPAPAGGAGSAFGR